MLDNSVDGSRSPEVVIIGAGPAGLSAAYEISKLGLSCTVLEKSAVVGGLARTEEYKGYRFDIGGHRFFTKSKAVDRMWHEILGADFIRRPRLSRIYYKSQFFSYPLDPMGALLNLGFIESARCMFSYLAAKMLPVKQEISFEHWVCNRFGRRLFEIFFKTYTEKVWGMPCDEIQAEWAAQRIQGLSVSALVRGFFGPVHRSKQDAIKTLIHDFEYPRLGPGMMWMKCQEIVETRGCPVRLNANVERIEWESGRVLAVHSGGKRHAGTHFISTMPVREMLLSLDPKPPEDVLRAADDFQYRDFILVALIIRGRDLFADNWIYVHDPGVKVGRIQNFNNWSPEMVPDPETTCLGMEYFCFEGDGLWRASDEELIERGKSEIKHLGLVDPSTVIDAKVVRVEKAYPIYNDTYKRGIRIVREFLDDVPNLQLVGRNGMHRYNNQDHSMMTGMLAVQNIMGANYDLWQVNADAEYHETGESTGDDEFQAINSTQPLVPVQASRTNR
jgi:protoporphyrinogen oxidase